MTSTMSHGCASLLCHDPSVLHWKKTRTFYWLFFCVHYGSLDSFHCMSIKQNNSSFIWNTFTINHCKSILPNKVRFINTVQKSSSNDKFASLKYRLDTMLNLTLQNNAGRSYTIMLSDNFDYEEFIKVVGEQLGSLDGYRFVLDGEQLDVDNEKVFNTQKQNIVDDKTIFVLHRLRGGAYLDTGTLINIILAELPDELRKLRKTKWQCSVCMESKQCVKICHGMLCEQCLTDYFKNSNLRFICVICHGVIPHKDVFVTREFIKSLQSLEELKKLLKNIDCQVCDNCGALAINETMYPKQRCKQCHRDFCFFCNKDWNDKTMRNSVKYTCLSGNCDYETRLSFELVNFAYNSHFPIPNRRCCPKCFNQGAYGGRCKYHTCFICSYEFCFFCLNTKTDCMRTYNSTYSHQCIEPVRQTYEMFPRLSSN